MGFLLFIIWMLVVLKAVLFWVYLWQIKEYRCDRFRAEYGKFKTILRFWLGSGGRRLLRPKFTIKSVLITLCSASIAGFLGAGVIVYAENYFVIFASFILIYLLTAFLVYLIVMICQIPTFFAKQILFFLARRKMERIKTQKDILVIGITGSYGKSSTKDFLYQILKEKFKVKKTPANINTGIGVAKTALSLLDGTEDIFIVEMGAYKIGEIKQICDIVRPKIGILTGIGAQHIDLFGSFENIKRAKCELIDSLPEESGLALFNGENKYCLELSWSQKWNGKKIIYKKIKDPKLLRFFLTWPEYYLENIEAAIEVARHLGMTDNEIEAACQKIKPEDRIIKTFIGKNGVLIIDDSYSANPDGVLANLTYLRSQPRVFRVLIMPCLIELGNLSREVHYEIGKAIRKSVNLAIITTPECFLFIKKEAGEQAMLESDPRKIIGLLTPFLNAKSVILLEGRVPAGLINLLA